MVVVSDQPPPYKLEFVPDVNSLNSLGNEVAMENLLEESEESDFVKHSTKFDESYDVEEMNFSTILGFPLTSQAYRITMAAMLVYSLLIIICQHIKRCRNF